MEFFLSYIRELITNTMICCDNDMLRHDFILLYSLSKKCPPRSKNSQDALDMYILQEHASRILDVFLDFNKELYSFSTI